MQTQLGSLDRTKRAELLARVPGSDALHLAGLVLDGSLGEVAVVSPATVGLVMARAQDGARGEVFNVGEVLVTEARVGMAGHDGWAMVLGWAPERAMALAILDAALEAGHAASATIEQAVVDLAAAADQAAAADLARLAPTRVRFEAL